MSPAKFRARFAQKGLLIVSYACRIEALQSSDTIEECASMSLGGTFSSLQIFSFFSLTSLGKTANRLIALFGRDGGTTQVT